MLVLKTLFWDYVWLNLLFMDNLVYIYEVELYECNLLVY